MDDLVKFRTLHGLEGVLDKVLLCLIPAIGLVVIIDVGGYIGIPIAEGEYLGVFLALILASVFVTTLPSKKAAHDRVPWYDFVLAGLGLVVGLYITVFYDDLLVHIGEITPERLVLAAIAVLLVLEATRRVAGWILVGIGTFFILYAAYAGLAPGGFAGRSVAWPMLLNYIYVDTNGLLGLPITVAGSLILGFIFFGQVLQSTGAGAFFTDLATASLGRYRGGPAKVATVASAMFGMISGSAVSNVVVSGSITIPLMKDTGYKRHVAGAIESVASTGGQLMPPVMGAAAFVIAQVLTTPYREVAIAAAFPAILYYLCLYVQVDLEAARHGLRGTVPSQLSGLSPRQVLLRGWPFIVSVAFLFYLLFLAAYPEAKGGVLAGLLALALGFLDPRLRRNPRSIFKCFEQTGRTLADLGVICALAGFIIGSMQISGLSFILSNALINLSSGNVGILLLLTAFVGIVLGMGMPTTAVYILLAVLVAPALVQMGIVPMAAHLFVFYFGMLSMITPPVCMAAFTAAAIAKAGFWRTGFEAMRLAGVAYIIPFMFVASPALILRGSLQDILAAVVTAILGTTVLGVALVGYFVRNLGWIQRGLIGICGIALIMPPNALSTQYLGWGINAGGLIIAASMILYEWRRRPVSTRVALDVEGVLHG